MSIRNCIVYVVTAMLVIPSAAFPRSPAPADPEAAQGGAPANFRPPAAESADQAVLLRKVRSLKIIALEGNDAVNVIPTRTVTVPVVEVHDENEMPVEGATVVFQLPATGPGGFFPGDKLTLTTVTNSHGQAAATGFRTNSVPGRFAMRVTAFYQNVRATFILTQTNSMEARAASGSHGSRKWLWIGIFGAAAAAAGITYAVRSGSSSSPTISASAGPVVVTAP
jgi:hypothetical protein